MKELYEMDVMPVSRLIWKLKEQSFQETIDKLRRECWLAEIGTVSEGLRKCGTFHLRSERIKEDLEWLENLGLVFLAIRKCKRVQGFAHKFYDVKPNEPYDIYGVVSGDIKYAKQFKKVHGNPIDNNKIGKLLGYPKCCIKFFNNVWSHWYDPIWQIAENTKGVQISSNDAMVDGVVECNILLRYFGIRLIPHLPCSFKCKEGKKFAKMFLAFIREKGKLIQILSSPMKWDCYKGVALVETEWFIGVANSMPYLKRHRVFLNRQEV